MSPYATTPDKTSTSEKNFEEEQSQEPVWTFRGYKIRPSEFNTAMVHLYRGEITRSNVWRERLDATTNWAVVTTGATITFAFNLNLGHHTVIILNTLLITLFLYIESRRYLYYELWTSRVRLMETDFFASMLIPPFSPAPDWAEGLAESLLHPDFPISMWEGFGRRFRRNYLWIYIILGVAWIIRVGLLPAPVETLGDFLSRAAVGSIPGWMVLLAGLVFNIVLMAIGMATVGLQKTTGEVLHNHANGKHGNHQEDDHRNPVAWYRSSRSLPKMMAQIVTDNPEGMAEHILAEMHRGVTSIPATGMYTGKSHAILMCALTDSEVDRLKRLVQQCDQHAFMIVSPVNEVLGEGFTPLEKACKP